jgi:uncharacterized membrane protein (UPF0127 family)
MITMETVSLKKGSRLIANNVELLESSDETSKGLMFANKGTVILVTEWEGRWSTLIHTFFCVPLLIAWINSKNIVVDVKKTMPWRFYLPKKPARYVFETTKMNTKIKIGDRITIKH